MASYSSMVRSGAPGRARMEVRGPFLHVAAKKGDPARRVPDVTSRACGVPRGMLITKAFDNSALRGMMQAGQVRRRGARDYFLQWGYFIL